MGYPPSPQVIRFPKAATSHVTASLWDVAALTAGLNRSGGTTVKVQGICDRDRSVHAGRSHFKGAVSSLYVLLDDCQGVARQVLVLSGICNTISTSVLICPISASMSQSFSCASIHSIQNRLPPSSREGYFEVWVRFDRYSKLAPATQSNGNHTYSDEG